MDDMIDAVAALLRQTARDHHQAYLATDGADPDWPWWYAEHLVDPLVDLGVSLTRSMIVFVLLSARSATFPTPGMSGRRRTPGGWSPRPDDDQRGGRRR